MIQIEDAIDDARDVATDFLNSEGRSGSHVALGVAVTIGFALAASYLARTTISPYARDLDEIRNGDAPITERPRGAFSLIVPAMFSATTLSAVRVWNAPANPIRTRAMGLWAVAQTVSAVWMALRPASRAMQIAAAMSSAGLAAAFAHEARKLDDGAGKLASPTGGRVRLANFLQRKTEHRPTVH